ncbi:MAG: DUF805 domain-containing protein [Actinobacteria bacterium]|nr:DUF805 domain-containing protein [Actinomycetota bacterium]
MISFTGGHSEEYVGTPYTPYPQGTGSPYGEPEPQRDYLHGGPVGFGEAITEGFRNIVNFSGRASRSAFWWFALGAIIIDIVVAIVARAAHVTVLQYIVEIIVALVSLSLAIRRLHDTNRSGWWWLIGLIPIIGGIILLVFYCLPGTPGPNKHG